VDTTLPRLDVTLKDNGQSYDLGVQYGNRKTVVTLTR
jgi:hypothetical protein